MHSTKEEPKSVLTPSMLNDESENGSKEIDITGTSQNIPRFKPA